MKQAMMIKIGIFAAAFFMLRKWIAPASASQDILAKTESVTPSGSAYGGSTSTPSFFIPTPTTTSVPSSVAPAPATESQPSSPVSGLLDAFKAWAKEPTQTPTTKRSTLTRYSEPKPQTWGPVGGV